VKYGLIQIVLGNSDGLSEMENHELIWLLIKIQVRCTIESRRMKSRVITQLRTSR
jgi:hypothetical protein